MLIRFCWLHLSTIWQKEISMFPYYFFICILGYLHSQASSISKKNKLSFISQKHKISMISTEGRLGKGKGITYKVHLAVHKAKEKKTPGAIPSSIINSLTSVCCRGMQNCSQHNLVFFTHQMHKILITDFIREIIFYTASKYSVIEGFKVHLIYIQNHLLRFEGKMCWRVSPKLPYKSPCILNVPILKKQSASHFYYVKRSSTTCTTCPQIHNCWIITIYRVPLKAKGKKKQNIKPEEN